MASNSSLQLYGSLGTTVRTAVITDPPSSGKRFVIKKLIFGASQASLTSSVKVAVRLGNYVSATYAWDTAYFNSPAGGTLVVDFGDEGYRLPTNAPLAISERASSTVSRSVTIIMTEETP